MGFFLSDQANDRSGNRGSGRQGTHPGHRNPVLLVPRGPRTLLLSHGAAAPPCQGRRRPHPSQESPGPAPSHRPPGLRLLRRQERPQPLGACTPHDLLRTADVGVEGSGSEDARGPKGPGAASTAVGGIRATLRPAPRLRSDFWETGSPNQGSKPCLDEGGETRWDRCGADTQ